MNKTPILVLLCLLALSFIGCTPLKEVAAFTQTSQAAMEKSAASTNYGYFDFCYDSALAFSHTALYPRDVECDCSYGTTSDTIISHAYSVLGNYFGALAKLADAKTVINTGPLGSAIPAGTYGPVTITSTQAGIFNALVTAAQDLLTDNYKSKKIREILNTYHDTVYQAITFLMDLARSNRGLIRTMSTRFKGTVDSLLTTISPGDHLALLALYRNNRLRWEQAAAAYEQKFQVLEKIRDDHDALYRNVEHLGDQTIRKQVLGFAQNIIYLSK